MTTDREFSNRRLIHALDYIDSKYIDEALGILTVPPRSGEYKPDRRRLYKAYAVFALRAACIMLLAGLVVSMPNILINSGIIGPFQTSGPGYVDRTETESNFQTTDYPHSSEEEDAIDSSDYEETSEYVNFTLELTEEEKEAFVKAYYNSENDANLKSLIWCVWKTDDYYAIKTAPRNIQVISEETVCGYYFLYGTSDPIIIFINNKCYSLTQAYNMGIIDEHDIKIIHQRYVPGSSESIFYQD